MTGHDRHPNYILAAYMASGTWPARASSGSSPGDARHCRIERVARQHTVVQYSVPLVEEAASGDHR